MNILFFSEEFLEYKQQLINEQLKESRVLLITKSNTYQEYRHCIETHLAPQDELIDDINRFVLRSGSSMIVDVWDDVFNSTLGQDVDSLLLSLLASFVNNITEPRKLIVDGLNDLSPAVQKRVKEIAKNSKRYKVSLFISSQSGVGEEFIMNSDLIYISNHALKENKLIRSLLSEQEVRTVNKMSPEEILLKKIGSDASVINTKEVSVNEM